MVHNQDAIAKVNRKTGVLYLDSKIWNGLPKEEKNFVLWHERGHLYLNTHDEFKANAYAVSKFLPAGTFTQKEFGQKIMVMRSALQRAEEPETSNFDPVSTAVAAASGIMQTLPLFGIGSKSRIKEAEANAAAETKVIQAQAAADASKSKSLLKIAAVVGVFVLLSVTIYFTLKTIKK